MSSVDYHQTLERFEHIARGKSAGESMLALIIDSPWLPGYAGVNSLDFYFDMPVWLGVHEKVLSDLPGVAFVPGSWVEFGMAAEPSGWGVPIQWRQDSPPAVHHYAGGLDGLLDRGVPNPEVDGLMPAILRRYETVRADVEKLGIAPRMAACRGPLATASHLLGVTEFLMATQMDAEKCLALLEKTTELCVKWLRCQLNRMEEPIGVLLLDDVVGMLSPADAEKFALPFLRRIFEAFGDLIHIYHNDTPNEGMLAGLSTIGMDVFNFTHEIDIVKVRALIGPDVVLMGNIPPLDVLVRGTTDDVRKATEELLSKAEAAGPVLVSPGGGVSPGTPIENLRAMLDVVSGG
jgi:uroporphyrinogen decarboxylase